MVSIFRGNCPRTVSSVGKYHLRQLNDRWSIQIDYFIDGEVVRSTTSGHQSLINLLIRGRNQAGGGAPGGGFYINEYEQVLIPERSSASYFLVGEYHGLMEFDVEGMIISASGVGNPPRLPPVGDPWLGPRHGIPYELEYSAGAWDIRYWRQFSNGDREVVRLSDYCSTGRVNEVGRLIRSVKRHPGRFYVNEQRQIFAPRRRFDEGWEMVYIGQLDLAPGWFPKPRPAAAQA